jgi:hypothetical protein
LILSRFGGYVGIGSLWAGVATFAVFFFLRHYSMFSVQGAKDVPEIEYSKAVIFMVPLGAMALAMLLSLVVRKKQAN